MHSDAVLWILASNELLYVIGFLTAILLFEDHRWWSVGAWIFALLSKETAIATLPILLMLSLQAATWRKRLTAFAPYAGAALAYLAMRAFVVPSGAISEKLSGLPWRAVLYTSPFLIADYLRKLVWPAGLSPMYGLPLHFSPSPLMWLMARSW